MVVASVRPAGAATITGTSGCVHHHRGAPSRRTPPSSRHSGAATGGCGDCVGCVGVNHGRRQPVGAHVLPRGRCWVRSSGRMSIPARREFSRRFDDCHMGDSADSAGELTRGPWAPFAGVQGRCGSPCVLSPHDFLPNCHPNADCCWCLCRGHPRIQHGRHPQGRGVVPQR